MEIKELIVNWLKEKNNYVYYDQENIQNNNPFHAIHLIGKLFTYDKILAKDLHSSPLYVVSKKLNYSIKRHNPHHTLSFMKFNAAFNRNFLDYYQIALFDYYFSNNKFQDSIRDRANFLTILQSIKNELIDLREKRYYKKIASHTNLLQKVFHNINIQNIDDIMIMLSDRCNSEQSLQVKYEELLSTYENKTEYNNITQTEEYGLFYPFVISHDVFDKKIFLFEINQFKFRKKHLDYEQILKDFSEEGQSNDFKYFNCLLEYYGKEEALIHYFDNSPGVYPSDIENKNIQDFAYLDPFYFFSTSNDHKDYTKLIKIKENLESNQFESQKILHKIFDLFNQFTFLIVHVLHTRLITSLSTYHSTAKHYKNGYKFASYLQILCRLTENNTSSFELDDLKEFRDILKKDTSKRKIINTIDDLNVAIPPYKKRVFNEIISMLNQQTLKEKNNLEWFEIFKNEVIKLSKNYKLRPKDKNYLLDVLKRIFSFYKNASFDERFNCSTKKYFKKYKEEPLLDYVTCLEYFI